MQSENDGPVSLAVLLTELLQEAATTIFFFAADAKII